MKSMVQRESLVQLLRMAGETRRLSGLESQAPPLLGEVVMAEEDGVPWMLALVSSLRLNQYEYSSRRSMPSPTFDFGSFLRACCACDRYAAFGGSLFCVKWRVADDDLCFALLQNLKRLRILYAKQVCYPDDSIALLWIICDLCLEALVQVAAIWYERVR